MPDRNFEIGANLIRFGKYSRGLVLPAWWLKMRDVSDRVSLIISRDEITIKLNDKEKADGRD